MKKVISMLVCIALLTLLFMMPASAEQPISVHVNGEKLEFDVEPVIMNGRTLVPMRKIFETLGATVSWNGDTESNDVREEYGVSVVSFILPETPETYQLDKVEISKTPFTGEMVIEKQETVEVPANFEPFKVTALNTGSNAQGFRVVVKLDQFPFTIKVGTLKGYPAHIKVTDKEGKTVETDVTILNSEERSDGAGTTLILPLDAFSGKIKMEGCKAELTISPKK